MVFTRCSHEPKRSCEALALGLVLTIFPAFPSAAAPDEAALFLKQFSSSELPALQALLSQHRAPPPQAFVLSIPEGRLGREEYAGDDYEYDVRGVGNSAGAIGRQAGFGRGGAAAVHGGGDFEDAHSLRRRWPLRRFAVFAHCVVRAFYIVRFEANVLPDDPMPHGVPDDPLCPDEPQAYLDKAERFADWFFHLS